MYSDELPAPVRDATIAKVKAAGKRGLIVPIGKETRALQVLVQDGIIWQSVASGGAYKFTIAK